MPRVLQCCPGCRSQHDVSGQAPGSAVACDCGARFGVATPAAHAPRALRCSRCGGNLRADASSCEYCQAEITLEERRLDSICPECFARMASDAAFCMECGVRIAAQVRSALPAAARCPRCSGALRSRRVGAEALVECGGCGGLWVEPELLERLCDDAQARKSVAEAIGAPGANGATAAHAAPGKGAAAARAPAAAAAPRAYIPCPTCAQPMNRKNFGSISGILIDACKDHGAWLDHGELARIVEFAGRGGLVEARRRELDELERRKQRAALDAPPAGSMLFEEPATRRTWTRGFGRRSSSGGLLGWILRELFD